jgi:hypothetical protein
MLLSYSYGPWLRPVGKAKESQPSNETLHHEVIQNMCSTECLFNAVWEPVVTEPSWPNIRLPAVAEGRGTWSYICEMPWRSVGDTERSYLAKSSFLPEAAGIVYFLFINESKVALVPKH